MKKQLVSAFACLALFQIVSVCQAIGQEEDPTPTFPGEICSQISFTENSLKKFNPATIYDSHTILSSSSTLNADFEPRIVGQYLSRNTPSFGDPTCFVTRVKSKRKVAACGNRDRLVIEVTVDGKTTKLRAKKETFSFSTIGLNFISNYSPYTKGYLYYFSNGIIRSVDVAESDGKFRLRMRKVGTYVGDC